MVYMEEDIREAQVLETARAMMTAARTAPKARGVDDIGLAVITGEEILSLAAQMRLIGVRQEKPSFIRDAGNLENSQAVVLIGARHKVRSLNCGLCGFPTCAEKVSREPNTPCTIIIADLGIALGSAVSVAADRRVDNRIMYTAGVAASELELLPGFRTIISIPLSVSGKSIFFDRQPK